MVPALKTNHEGLKKVLDDMVKQYKTKQDELDKWKVRSHLTPFKILDVTGADISAEEE